MMDFFHQFVYIPIYNILIFFVDIVPGGDLGLAVILATLAIRLVLMPLSLGAVKTQKAMKVMQPELKAIREQHKDNPAKQGEEMLGLYKKYGVKPFSSILMPLIQIPFVLGLFFVCKNAQLSTVDPSILYSFIPTPELISPFFLGLFAVTSSSIALAIFAGFTQFLYAVQAVPIPAKPENTEKASMQEEFGRAMAIQMRYVFPFLIAFVGYASGAIALYLAAGNLFMLAQTQLTKTPKEDVATA